jgi:hypothetical protein
MADQDLTPTPPLPPSMADVRTVTEEHPERHEHSDVSIRGITYTAIGITIVAVIVHTLLWVLQNRYLARQEVQNRQVRRTLLEPAPQEPPADVPRLQGLPGYHAPTPMADMDAFRDAIARELTTYGRSPDGTYHIPVEAAVRVALEQNAFPTRQAAPSTGAAATTQPAGTGSPQPQQGGSHGTR